MNDASTCAPGPRRPALPAALVELVARGGSPAGLRDLPAVWVERSRFRRALARLLKRTPHLIDDIGLTREQAEAEVAKPFWRA